LKNLKVNQNNITVALCTFNGSLYIEKQLDSILAQTHPIDEIIIVDDCSSDSTREILINYEARFENIKLFFNDVNLGSNGAFKYAMALSNNEFIALCDQDDIWNDNKIETQMNLLSDSNYSSRTPLVIFHDLCLMDQSGTIKYGSFWKVHKFNAEKFDFKKLFITNIVTGCTCIINKSMKDEVLKCDMKHILMHDYLIALIGYGYGNVAYINEPLMYYRSHSSSVTVKEKITLQMRIFSFYSRVKTGKYLMPHILQMKQFKNLYWGKLDSEKQRSISSFINLENKSILYKIFYKWLTI